MAASGANALPGGGQVAAGQAAISTPSASQMNITQGTNQAIINWNSFGIGRGEAVNIAQPSSQSSLLNRVLGNNPSNIFGSLNANGRVFLVNPSGVLFAPGASVNVGGLVASSLNIKDNDFLAGKYSFFKDGSTGSVVNQGNITGGFVALLGNSVENAGTIVTTKGSTGLAAGDEITLGFDPNGFMAIKVDKSAYQAQVTNSGIIEADGGSVIMTASAADALLATVVNNSGTVRARGMVERNGEIIIEGGSVTNSGTLDASGYSPRPLGEGQGEGGVNGGKVTITAANSISHSGGINVDAAANSTGSGGSATLIASLSNPDSITSVSGNISARGGELGGNGGFVETSGAHVKVSDTARIGTAAAMGLSGSWLIDPADFTIGSTKTGTVTTGTPSGDISGATLTAALAGGSVTILSSQGSTASGSGDINVNDAVSWSAANTLTLTAARNINVNAVMTATGTAALTLNPATANGADAAVTTGNVLMGMSGGAFTGRIDYSASGALTIGGSAYTVINSQASLQAMAVNTAGVQYVLGSNITLTGSWAPIGGGMSNINSAPRFYGKFDGLGHTISGLSITKATTSANANWYIGLFGFATNSSSISNVGLVSPVISGGYYGIGALAGLSYGAIRNSYASGVSISGSGTGGAVGGLVGWLNATTGSIDNSYSSGSVSGDKQTGGLVGKFGGLTLSNSYSTANVTGTGTFGRIGGLVGTLSNGTLSTSHASGNVGSVVNARQHTGGLVGMNNGAISDSYATGTVIGAANVGGLVGNNYGVSSSPASVTNSYFTTGTVTGTTAVGGFVGLQYPYGSITKSYSSATSVTGTGAGIGGFVGKNQGTITNSFWDTTTSGKANGLGIGLNGAGAGVAGVSGTPQSGVTGLDTAGMQTKTNFTDATWDFTTRPTPVWGFASANSYPILCSLGTCILDTSVAYTLAALTGTYTYNGNAYLLSDLWSSPTAIFGSTYSAWVAGTDYSFSTTSYTNAGTYTGITMNILKSGFAVAGSGNTTGSLTIAKAPLSVTANAVNTTYNAAAYAGTPGVTYSGFVTPTGGTQQTSAVLGGTLAYAYSTASPTNAGNYTITPSGQTSSNYTITNHTGTLTINKADAIISAARSYDGSTTLASSTLTVSGVNGETLTLGGSGTATAASKNFADNTTNYISSFGSLALVSGTGTASNYQLPAASRSSSNSVTLSKANLTLSPVSDSKTYDGTLASTAVVTVGGSKAASDTVTVAEEFASKNVGSPNLAIKSGYTILDASNADMSGNYTITANGTASGTISKATATVTGARSYDGSTTLASGNLTISGVNGETLSFGGSGNATASSKNVVDNASNYVSSFASLTLANGSGGTVGLASNYQLPAASRNANNSVTLSKASLTLTPASDSKTYDGTTASTATVTVGGKAASDTVTVAEQFGSKNALGTNGSTLSIKAGYTVVDGSSADMSGNYTITASSTATGTITAKPVTLTAPVISKTYDGLLTYSTQSADLTTLSGQLGVSGDTVTAATLAFTDKNAGSSSKTVNITAPTISDGNSGNNYTVTLSGNSGSTISKAGLSIAANAANKTYNAVAYSGGNGVNYSGFVNNEDSTALGGTLSYTGSSQASAIFREGILTLQGIPSCHLYHRKHLSHDRYR